MLMNTTLRNTLLALFALAPGALFTVEPGIYIPEEGIGIRLEDEVLVTPSGHEVLSAALPRTAEDIEEILADR